MKKRIPIFDEWLAGSTPRDGGKSFFRNNLVRFSLLGGVALNVIGFALLAFFVRSQQTVVILHYNVYFGVDLIGDREQAFLVPGGALLIFAINTLLAKRFYEIRERIAAYVLLLASLMVGIGSVIACAVIALINY